MPKLRPLGPWAMAFVLLAAGGCYAGEGGSPNQSPDVHAQPDVPTADVATVDAPAPEPCVALFGLPTETTGLDEAACAPSCQCGEAPWTPPAYDAAFVEALGTWTLAVPFELLASDPYESPDPESPPAGSVCAARFDLEAATYTLETHDGALSAASAGAAVTHAGACGLCSSLQNLAVYLGKPDLTEPVRLCGVEGILGSAEENVACLEAIGFDSPCAQIWYFNTRHTSEVCLDVCMALLDAPNHHSDGSLNDCIQCDEDESGAVFKAFAGRTRRNSGLPSALCRPCDSVYQVEHDGLW